MGRWDDDPSMMGMGQGMGMEGMDPMMLQHQMMRERMYMEVNCAALRSLVADRDKINCSPFVLCRSSSGRWVYRAVA